MLLNSYLFHIKARNLSPRTVKAASEYISLFIPLGLTGTVVARVIVFDDALAGYLPDLAIFNVNVHEPVEPIVNVVGLLFGVNVHEPFFDQVLPPGEFVLATADKFLT